MIHYLYIIGVVALCGMMALFGVSEGLIYTIWVLATLGFLYGISIILL